MHKTPATLSPPIIFEVLSNVTRQGEMFLPSEVARSNSDKADELHAFLGGLGYRIVQIRNTGEEVDVQAFVLDDPDKSSDTNYLARKA